MNGDEKYGLWATEYWAYRYDAAGWTFARLQGKHRYSREDQRIEDFTWHRELSKDEWDISRDGDYVRRRIPQTSWLELALLYPELPSTPTPTL